MIYPDEAALKRRDRARADLESAASMLASSAGILLDHDRTEERFNALRENLGIFLAARSFLRAAELACMPRDPAAGS